MGSICFADESRKARAAAGGELTRTGLPFTEARRAGYPGVETARSAVKSKSDLVLMGPHGHGMPANLVLDSCTSKVLAQRKRPLLVIR